jgi:hypothetical protein
MLVIIFSLFNTVLSCVPHKLCEQYTCMEAYWSSTCNNCQIQPNPLGTSCYVDGKNGFCSGSGTCVIDGNYSCPTSCVGNIVNGCHNYTLNLEIPCIENNMCNYNIQTLPCAGGLDCLHGTCGCALCGQFGCTIPKNNIVRSTTIPSNQLTMIEMCQHSGFINSGGQSSSQTSCEYQNVTFVEMVPKKIGVGFYNDPVIMQYSTNGNEKQLCFSFYKYQDYGSYCAYYCYSEPDFSFNYYEAGCDNIYSCETMTKTIRVRLVQSKPNTNNPDPNTKSVKNSYDKLQPNALLLLVILFLNKL